MTAQTPVYGLEYITEGEPARNARAALENNAKTIEAALILGGIAPPEAQDLAVLSGRVTALEADTGWTTLTYGAGWSGGWMRYRITGDTAWLSINAARASYTAGTTVCTLPTAARPAVSIAPTGSYLAAVVPVDIATTGAVVTANSTAATGLTLLTSWPLG